MAMLPDHQDFWHHYLPMICEYYVLVELHVVFYSLPGEFFLHWPENHHNTWGSIKLFSSYFKSWVVEFHPSTRPGCVYAMAVDDLATQSARTIVWIPVRHMVTKPHSTPHLQCMTEWSLSGHTMLALNGPQGTWKGWLKKSLNVRHFEPHQYLF